MLNAQGATAPDEAGRGTKNAKKNKSGNGRSSDAATAKASARDAKDGRERTAAETTKAAKTAPGGKENELQRLAADVALLRAEMKGLRDVFTPPAGAHGGSGKKNKNAVTTFADAAPTASGEFIAGDALAKQAADALAERHDGAVLYGWAFRAGGDEQQSGARAVFGLETLLARCSDDRAARVAYALSSGPKIALARLLLTHGALPAARLGEEAQLTTGSLYHHLREMTHAGVVGSAGRSLYALTTTGQQAILLLLALSTDEIAASKTPL